jgi:hypothetical protein
METTKVKTVRSRKVNSLKSAIITKEITEDDIRRRAYEIYLDNTGLSHSELDDWLKAEKELRTF